MNTVAALTAFVAVQVSILESPSFRQRERSRVALTSLLPLSLPDVEHAADHAADPHTQAICEVIANRWYCDTATERAASMLPAGYPRLPWVDMLPNKYPYRHCIISMYLDQAQKKIGYKGPPDWADYRLATQLYLSHLLMTRSGSRQAQRLLDQMRDVEIRWIEEHGKRYTPPIDLPVGRLR